MAFRQTVLRASVIVLAVGLSSCSTTKIDPSFVAERWSITLSAFNIDPVFPPRYLQPGDIFLVMDNPAVNSNDDKNRYKRRAVRLGRAEVRTILMEDAQKALLLPSTTNSNPNLNVFSVPDKILRLRPMGFTGFNIAAVRQSDLGLAWPAQAFRVLIGLAERDELVMSISIPNAEHIELPALEASSALGSFCYPKGAKQNRCDVNSYEMKLAMESLKRPDEEPNAKLVPKIVIITQVYYARQIDYSYTTKGGAALAASIAAGVGATTGSGSGAGTKSASGVVVTPTPSGSTSTGPISPAVGTAPTLPALSEEVKALQSQLDALKSQLGTTDRAATLQVLTANSEGTILRQTFDTPVAIGYRGLSVIPTGR